MKTLYLLIFIGSNFSFCLAQNSKFQLIDDINNSPIKYANIRTLDADFGTTSDSLGYFQFDKNQTIIINAVGYDITETNLKLVDYQIKVAKNPISIENVIIKKRKNQNELTIDAFKTSNIDRFYGLSSTQNVPWIIGKYFKNESYKTNFLKNISVFTMSQLANAKFNIRIYSVDKNNQPETELYSENIISIAKKGSNKTKIDLSKTNIQIPENGIFIAVDWLKINENIYEYNYTIKGKKGKIKSQSYVPAFGCVLDEDKYKTMIFTDNKWQPATSQSSGEYWVLAMELVLSD